MSEQSFSARFGRGLLAAAAGLAVAVTGLVPGATAANAATAWDGVVINEAYLSGGSAGAAYTNKFVELYNTTDRDISLTGTSLQYRSATGSGSTTGVTALTGTIKAKGYYLVQGGSNGANGAALPAPDASGSLNPSGTTGTVLLAVGTSALTIPTGSVVGDANVVDLLGYGTSNTFEGTVATAPSGNTDVRSNNRTDGVDTDDNRNDFSLSATITPQNSASTGGGTDPTDPTDPEPGAEKTIAEIQGTGATSPEVGNTVTTRGVVTASYATGGFNGFYIQTPGTGGDIDLAAHTASDGIFAYGGNAAGTVAVGDYVKVTGVIAEYRASSATTPGTLTQILPANAAAVEKLTESVTPPQPAKVAFPRNEAQRESLEGMLIEPQGDYTVSNTYSTNAYGTVGLATGTSPLITPTEAAKPGTQAYQDVVADNAARGVVLDDGASTNYGPSASAANKAIPLPYLSKTKPVRVGAKVAFTRPVILDYRFDVWGFQPTQHITGQTPEAQLPVSFENTRTPKPEEVGGDLKLATFNVLNYFTTTGDQVSGCSFYNDRDGNPIAVNTNCDARGAANAVNLKRQEDKIVAAINGLGADVVSLEEIENSVKFGKDRDDALSKLVAALNAKAGPGTWSFVPSPAAADLPAPSAEDVIRNAYIYRSATAETVGGSVVLTGNAAFSNAREPLAQAFKAKGAPDAAKILVITNHFKSKSGPRSGSPAPSPENQDTGDGQGYWNGDRKAQATALVAFADAQKQAHGTERVFLVGDFNAYAKEDPIGILEAAGYVNQGAKTGKYSYSFSGQSGSLDVIFASEQADEAVTGADIWNINAPEAIALEYSRYNYNVTDFYDDSAYRSSDHDPVLVGVSNGEGEGPSETVKLNLLNINDFHGRIDKTTTVQFAGTIEQLRKAEGEDNTLFLSDGDNIGASLFNSSVQKDQPTIDVLNALDLKASAVGNHEFDLGMDDLTGRVIGAPEARNAKWDYLGANVYQKGTQKAALKEYSIQEIDGLKVAIIGAVTAETPTLVGPAGVADLEFGDPVDAVNRVAAQLTDGNAENGEADVLIAEYHEGASAGLKEGATLDQELAQGGVFAKIVNETSPKVSAIFTGHTHKEYSWDGPVKGSDAKRAVLQTGNYGENIGQNVLTIDRATKNVLSYEAKNVKRTTAAEADLVAEFPRVAQVKTIVDAALAYAATEGQKPVGSATADITTAHTGGAYGVDGYGGADAKRDDRANQSALGSLVADSLVESLKEPRLGGAEIGISNPGGMRDELRKGTITYAQANAVLPFANNLWTTSLTGADLKSVLEQQWQRDAAGNVPSRPFLALSVSKNVRYTFDTSKPEGERITGIWVSGARVTDTAKFRVAAPSFLIEGGDNFTAFKKGTDARDSGLVDRDAWMAYLTAHENAAPDFAKRGVEVQNVPSAAVRQGSELSFRIGDVDGANTKTNGGLNLTSLGSPDNTAVKVSFAGSSVAPAEVSLTDGKALVKVPVPSDVSGDVLVKVVGAESGTEVTIPVTVEQAPVVEPEPVVPAISVKFARTSPRYGQSNTATVTVSADGVRASGDVQVAFDGKTLAKNGRLSAGKYTVTLPKTVKPGTRSLVAKFLGTKTVAAGQVSKKLKVAKGKASVSAKLAKSKITRKQRGKVTVTAKLSDASGVYATGKLRVLKGKKVLKTVSLKSSQKGKVRIALPKLKKGKHALRVQLQGGLLISKATSKRFTLRVR
ncbi:ExeM/NucH family extracellular endonuclease [Leucobacter weissii]|uniref:ExeM/NucH family extracellular endonuclease n=1 Tax=Leucobacter weissii TaxID=1983706 RepID=A0A939S4S0_9MICO|nr:ExeM/NucH family extracellular endonuclease [Leucobacter weissii]MBO1900564.1 ExeM/NucH family extracellular endonuclease [Leucobacter weissii]